MADTIQIKVIEQGASGVLTTLQTIQTTINTLNNTKVNISVDPKVLNSLARVQNANAKLISAQNQLKVAYEKTKQETEKRIAAEAKLATQMERTATQTEKTATKQVELQIQQEKTNTVMEKAKAKSEKLADTLENRLGTALTNLITRLGRRYLISTFNEAVDTMQAVDDELVNISKITGQTVDELGDLEDAAYRVAAALGVSADEHLSNTAAFYRAGYREQADELALLADKIEIISGMTAEQAQQFIISADAAYGYKGNVEALTKVMDGAISIDNNYATTVQKIAEGIGIVAPVAAQAHVSMEELTAALGTITAVTQRTGSESARALRATFLNIIGDTTTEIDEGVTWTTGEIAGLRELINEYAADVVKAAEATNSVINPMEALHALNLAMKDGTLNEVKLMETVNDIGGKLRSSQILAIVQNWDMYESMLAEFETSAGNTEAKVEAAMDSWSVKSQQLQNAWTEFVSNLVDTGAIKSALDGVIKLVELLNTDFGRTVVVFTTVATAGVGLAGVIGNIVGAIRNAAIVLGVSNPIILGIAAAIGGVTAAIYAVKSRNEELHESINALAPEIGELNKAISDSNEVLEKSKTAYSNAKTEAEVAAFKAEYYVKRLKELETQGDETAESQREYKTIVEQLNGLIPDLSLEIDSQTGYITTQTDAIYDQIDAWKDLAIQQALTSQQSDIISQIGTLTVTKTRAENKQQELYSEYDAAKYQAQQLRGRANDYDLAYKQLSKNRSPNKEEVQKMDYYAQKAQELRDKANQLESDGLRGYAAGTDIEKEIANTDSQIAALEAELDELNDVYRSLYGSDIPRSSGNAESTDTTTTGNSSGSGTTTTTTTTTKSANELMLETIQATKAVEEARLSYLKASGASAEELVEQYKLLQGITHDEAEKLRDIEESQNGVRNETSDTLKLSAEWWKYQDEINELLEESTENAYDVKSALEETVALLKEVNKGILDEQTAAIDAQIEALEAKNDAEKESNSLAEKRLALLEAENKLRNAKDERLIRVFNADSGHWERISEQGDVESAQKAVDEARQALTSAQNEATTNAQITALQAEKAALKAQYEEQESAWDNLLKSLEEPTKDLAAAFKELAENGTPAVVESLLNTATSFGISEEDIAQTLKKFGVESVEGALGTALTSAGVDVNAFAQELIKTTILNRMMRRSDAWFDASETDKANLAKLNEQDAAILGLTKKDGAWYWPNGELAYQTDTQRANTTTSTVSGGSTTTAGTTTTSSYSDWRTWAKAAKAGETYVNGAFTYSKNADGTVTVSSGGQSYTGKDKYDSGGILHGMGGIKATNDDEMVLPPNVTKALLSPQNSSAFSQRLAELGFLYGANTSGGITPVSGNSVRSSQDHYGDTYQYGNITLTESQAKGMTVYDLARLSRGLSIYS